MTTTPTDGPPAEFIAPGATPVTENEQPRKVTWGDEDMDRSVAEDSAAPVERTTLGQLRELVVDNLEHLQEAEDIVVYPMPNRKNPKTGKPFFALELSTGVDLNKIEEWRAKFSKGRKRRGLPVPGAQQDDTVDTVQLAAQVVAYYCRRIWLLDDAGQPAASLTRGFLDPDAKNPDQEVNFKDANIELLEYLKAIKNGQYNVLLGVRKFFVKEATLVSMMSNLIGESGIYDDFEDISREAETPTVG